MSADSIRDDLAFMKSLAESGGGTQWAGGAAFVAGGALYGLQCLVQWAQAAGLIVMSSVSDDRLHHRHYRRLSGSARHRDCAGPQIEPAGHNEQSVHIRFSSDRYREYGAHCHFRGGRRSASQHRHLGTLPGRFVRPPRGGLVGRFSAAAAAVAGGGIRRMVRKRRRARISGRNTELCPGRRVCAIRLHGRARGVHDAFGAQGGVRHGCI